MTERKRYDLVFYLPRASSLLSRNALPSEGGGETQVVLVCRALAERGLDVCLVVFDLPDADIPESIYGFDVVVRPAYVAHGNLRARLREFARVRDALNSVDAPVCATRLAGPQMGLAALATKLGNRRFVHSFAGLRDFQYELILPKRRDRILYRIGIALADGLVAQTGEQIGLAEQRFGKTPVLIRSIAEPAPLSAAPAEAFIWVGRIERNKRPLEFVELARSLPHARFWMVATPSPGDPENAGLWEEIERASGSLPNFEVRSPMPRADLLELVARSAAVVSTSEFEGMPNTLLEGWSRGIPALVLSYDPDGIVARHGLGGFADGRRDRLVELAREFWENPVARRACSIRCWEYVRARHSPEAVAAEWDHVIRPGVTARHESRDRDSLALAPTRDRGL